jgi:hypothetical protein
VPSEPPSLLTSTCGISTGSMLPATDPQHRVEPTSMCPKVCPSRTRFLPSRIGS